MLTVNCKFEPRDFTALTVRSKPSNRITNYRSNFFPIMTFNQLSPEQRVLLSAVFLVLAEQDELLIRAYTAKDGPRYQIADDAREYVASEDFNIMCSHIGVDTAYVRSMTPREALDVFEALNNDKETRFTSRKAQVIQ